MILLDSVGATIKLTGQFFKKSMKIMARNYRIRLQTHTHRVLRLYL